MKSTQLLFTPAGVSTDGVFFTQAVDTEAGSFFSGLVFKLASYFLRAPFFSTDFIFLGTGTPAGLPLSLS